MEAAVRKAGSARVALQADLSPILSRGLDGNAPRLLLGTLRDGDFQHPVHVPGLDRLGIGALRKGEAAQERAVGALDALETVRGRLLLRAALAADRQHALVGGDLDVLAFDARHVSDPYEALGFLTDVDMRDPADARGIRAVSTLAHGAIELLLEAAQERPRLVTNDGHNCSPVGCWKQKSAGLARLHRMCGAGGAVSR